MDGWLGSNHHGTCWLSWKFNGSSNSLVEKVEQVILQSFPSVSRLGDSGLFLDFKVSRYCESLDTKLGETPKL